jgi:hypothetical protein
LIEFDSIERKKFANGCGFACQDHMPAYWLTTKLRINSDLEAKRRRLAQLLISLSGVLAATVLLSFPAGAERSYVPRIDLVGQAARYTGPGSCASSACHGSVTPRSENRVLQNEYSTWIVKDKHSKAYASLKGTVGERMTAILGVGKAELAPKCLALTYLQRSELARLI